MSEVYANYKDDGPKGICGQDAYTTSCWNKIYIFEDYASFYEWQSELKSINHRKIPRVEGVWESRDIEVFKKEAKT